jgi:universal stress protein E
VAAPSTPRTILVIVDPFTDQEQPVVGRAAWLAERFGAHIELFACDYNADIDSGRVATVAIPDADLREQRISRNRRQLESFAAALRGRRLQVTVNIAWDYPLDEAIVRHVVATRPWLVAKDTHHHNVLQRTLFTNTDWNLIRDCPAPLLLVKPREVGSRPTVIAAVDPVHEHDKPAQLDDAIYRFASELSENTGGAMHLTHAISMPLGVQLPPNVQAIVTQEHRRALDAFLMAHPVRGENLHVHEGLAHQCLQHVATSQHADFLVMGAVARRGIKKVLIGSTAARVLDRLPCDLVIIKPATFFVPSS